MFYSQFILAKKGPLGTIWIAAHLERKLRKNQVADTDIGVSVDSILFPEVPIALRLSSHLLLGVVRIYSRKVNYLFDDCSEALLKIKQAFRSTAVDLPPEESTAPYHSITLPETFDLDDFELPDNEIYQGNYVDHHVSSREQITLQDTMDGVVYTTSQFGLDERFGDGDTSQIGLDLDEELFLDKVTVKELDGILDAEPQEPFQSTVLKDTDENTDEIPENIELLQGPCTTGQVDECNLSSVQATDDPVEEDYNVTEQGGTGIEKNESRKSDIYGGASNASNPSSHNDLDFEAIRSMHPEQNGHLSSEPENKDGKLEQLSSSTKETEKIKGDALDGIISGEEMNNGVVINNEPGMIFVDQVDAECEPNRPALDGTAMSPSRSGVTPDVEDLNHNAPSNTTFALASEGCLIVDQTSSKHIDSSSEMLSPGKVALDTTYREESPGRPEVIDAESKEFQEPKDTETQNSFIGEEIPSMEKSVLQPCNSHPIEPDRSSLEGESSRATDAVTQDLGKIEHPETELLGDRQTDCRDSDKQLDCAVYNDTYAENSNRPPTCDFPAAEKLVSIPEGLTERPENLPLESTLVEENPLKDDGGLSGINLVSGKKRSFTESTLTAQSLNSAESVGGHRYKRTTESIPDDDDLLSSILVGRRSSVLKMKPSPTVHETLSLKRPRSALRVGASKKKVLMDDMMVLHGDTIRLQLTSTEDIRRVRKKAPCTRPEILIIQRQSLEDEILRESIYSGISRELSLLHTGAFHLSGIRVLEDAVTPSIEAVTDFESSVRPNAIETVTDFESSVRPNAIETVTDFEPSVRPNATGESTTETKDVAVTDQNHLESHLGNISVQNESEEAKETLKCPNLDVQEQQGTLTKSDELEPPGEMVEMEIGAENVADAANGFIIPELELQALVIEDRFDDPNVSMQMDISCFSPEKMLDSQPDVVDAFTMNTGNIGADTVDANDSTEIRNSVDPDKSEHDISLLTSPPENGECSYLTPENGDKLAENFLNDKLGGVDEDGVNTSDFGCDVKDPASVCLIDGVKMDSQFSPGFSMDFKGASFNEGVNPGYSDADLLNVVDTEITTFDHPIAENHGDFEDATVANDIEFLNDDDAEEDEDDMQFAADATFLENSGWSSRTRAVARYLQNIFDKEAIHGRKVLQMDNLLVNKTRKEASRMFFETLVLKTRDYIHVEQEKPFDTIHIKARINLMKSNF